MSHDDRLANHVPRPGSRQSVPVRSHTASCPAICSGVIGNALCCRLLFYQGHRLAILPPIDWHYAKTEPVLKTCQVPKKQGQPFEATLSGQRQGRSWGGRKASRVREATASRTEVMLLFRNRPTSSTKFSRLLFGTPCLARLLYGGAFPATLRVHRPRERAITSRRPS